MEKKDNLKLANELENEIRELKYFLTTVTKFDRDGFGIPSVTVFFKKKVDIKCSILGTRFFGCGTHRQEIEIPDTVRNDIIRIAEQRLIDAENEFSELIN